MARKLDDLLWTFRDGSFVPHGLWEGQGICGEPVALGWLPGNPNGARCLVLARRAIPTEVGGFDEVFDFALADDPAGLERARQRQAAYRAAGFALSSPDALG